MVRLATLVLISLLGAGVFIAPQLWPWVQGTPAYFLGVLLLAGVVLAAAAGGAWGAIGLLITHARGRPARRSHRSLAALLVMTAVLVIGTYSLGSRMRGPLPTGSYLLTFDPAEWARDTATDPGYGGISVRQKMLGDVVERVLPGRHRRDLETLLGPSSETSFFASSGRDLIYRLGMERDSLFGVDSEWLLIWLDASGRFERYEIWRD